MQLQTECSDVLVKSSNQQQIPTTIQSSVSVDYDDEDDSKDDADTDFDDGVPPISSKYAPKPEKIERFQSVGISQFEITLNNASDDNVLANLMVQQNWNMLIDSMFSNLSIGPSVSVTQQLQSLQSLRGITKRVLDNDPAGHEINTGDPQFLEKYHGIIGIDSFLRGIGYVQIDAGGATKYEYHQFNRKKYRPIIEVAQSAILQKTAMLKLLQKLKRVWDQAVESMFKEPVLESQFQILSSLTGTDFVRDYSAYHALLERAETIGHNPDYNDDRKKVAVQILNHFGLRVEVDVCTLEMLQSVYSVYDAIRRIEELREQQQESGARKANLKILMNDSMDFGMIPDLMRDGPMFSTTKQAFAGDVIGKYMMDEAATFGRYWGSDDFKLQELTDQELDDLFYGRASPELLDKVNVLEAYTQQLDEYWKYIQNMDKMEDLFVEQKCDDPHCQWDKDCPPLAMSPHQILHVMIYHSAGL